MTKILKEGEIKKSENEIIGVKCDFCDTEFETDEQSFIGTKYVYPHTTVAKFYVNCPFCKRHNIIIFRDGKQSSNKIPR